MLRIPFTEGRSVCLCWAPSKPKGPKAWRRLSESLLGSYPIKEHMYMPGYMYFHFMFLCKILSEVIAQCKSHYSLWARYPCRIKCNPVGLGKVWTAFDRVSIKLRALLSRSKHFVNEASFEYLAKGFVHLQGCLAHKRQRPPRTLQ